jgi:uncharacterized protein YjiS (DUF1127 family)
MQGRINNQLSAQIRKSAMNNRSSFLKQGNSSTTSSLTLVGLKGTIRRVFSPFTKLRRTFYANLPGHPLMMTINQWQHNRRTRRQLAELPDYLLKDIGLSRCSVENELQKPFWRD